MKYIERDITESICQAAKFYPVITITGPRQSGKSTLSRNLFPDYEYVSLEDPDARVLALNDPRAFLTKSSRLILDEVQRCPDLLSYIQTMVDSDDTRCFVLTGSSHFAMMKSVSQTLAGRTCIFELLPLSWNELRQIGPFGSIDSELFTGFYPGQRVKAIPHEMFFKNYTATYVERDIREISNIRDLDLFQRFVRLCAGRIGNLFVASELANDLGVSVNTVTAWLGLLQASYIVYMLEPFSLNTNRRLIKSRKLYFTDTGLAAYLLGLSSPDQLNIDRMRGALFENFIVVEALKKRFNAGKSANLCFYRDSNGVEIDLMAFNGKSYDCFEIRSAMTYHSSFEKSLKSVSAKYGDMIGQKNIIYTGPLTTSGDINLLNLTNFYPHL